jgi:predicted DNA-binding protein (UPF0251 family)
VLSLFAVDGLSHREIGEILGVPEGTIWSRLHAARKRLAAELGRGVPARSDPGPDLEVAAPGTLRSTRAGPHPEG